MFGPKSDEVTGEWRKLHSEELLILYTSPNVIRQIRSRRMRWAGHVARLGRRGKCIRFWWESNLEDQGIDERMGSEWILGDWMQECRVDPFGSGQGPVAGYCENPEEPSGSGATD
jgi:hypothetical protein